MILTTGTFLRGAIFVGEARAAGGRAGEAPSVGLSHSLADLGFPLARLKTGTPCRIDRKTIDVAGLELQPGDDPPPMFRWSREVTRPPLPQIACWVTYTNERTHAIIREGLPRSPLYRKDIEGTGPRYCPSIEDKVVRFADKDRHQIYLEPEGLDSAEVYPNGISTSLPFDVQLAFLRTIPGPRARGDDAAGLRGRVRLHRSARGAADARDPARARASTTPARSTAPRATRRRRSRASSPGSTRRSRSASARATASR